MTTVPLIVSDIIAKARLNWQPCWYLLFETQSALFPAQFPSLFLFV